jgi:hypothetical protein
MAGILPARGVLGGDGLGKITGGNADSPEKKGFAKKAIRKLMKIKGQKEQVEGIEEAQRAQRRPRRDTPTPGVLAKEFVFC